MLPVRVESWLEPVRVESWLDSWQATGTVAACDLLDTKVAFCVQGAILLGIVISLVLKKRREAPERLWRVFILDVSKQLFGAGFVHLLNLLFATALWNDSQFKDEACTWYWINIMADTTVGVLLDYLLLKVVTGIAECLTYNLEDFHTGMYMDSCGRIAPSKYFKQLGIWLCTILVTKTTIERCFVFWQSHIFYAASEILRPVCGNQRAEIVFVMIVTPCVMKAIQFWTTDNFLKQGGVTFRDCGSCCCHSMKSACVGSLCQIGYRGRRSKGEHSTRCCPCFGRRRLRSLSDHAGPLLQTKADELKHAMRRADELEEALKKAPPPEVWDELQRTRVELHKTKQELRGANLELMKTQEMLDEAREKCKGTENDTRERLYQAEQLLRLSEQEKQTLQQQLLFAKEIQQQLQLRASQLGQSYAAVVPATRAVLAAETAASAVA